MSKRSTNYRDCRLRGGLTLIEVVAGLLLVSTLLVGILLACGRHVKQTKLAQKRLAAAALAERLLGAWLRDSQSGAAGDGGASDDAGLHWRICPVRGQDVFETLNLEIVRLEILDARATNDEKPLVAVEFVRSRQQVASVQPNTL